MQDEVAVAAERFRRIEAAIKHVRRERHGKLAGCRGRGALVISPDRCRRARDQRAVCGAQLLAASRLLFDEGELAGLAESSRSKLAAGVAIDAGGIDEERSLRVLPKTGGGIGHTIIIAS